MPFNMKLQAVLFMFAYVAVIDLVQANRGKRDGTENEEMLDVVDGKIQKMLQGSAIADIITQQETSRNVKQGKCIESHGQNVVYDSDTETCLNCSEEDCTSSDSCRAQCAVVKRLSELEIRDRSNSDEHQDLYWRSNFEIAAFVIVCILVFLKVCYEIHKWRISQFDKTVAPTGDALPRYTKNGAVAPEDTEVRISLQASNDAD